ncbi:CD209 antigen-like protein D [Ylistrum balloti]|uniref:CD209 antigen-like protein D n=1 Tax=Ylistrum balloti TaxID=509963 RepID=UPI002905EFCF|nr:CD209 antigen-like protein D [Ylistrum balloti]
MSNVSLQHLILISIFALGTFLHVDGHGLCASSLHKESSSHYKAFMHLDTIGVLQCLKVCKRYKLCEKIHHDRDHLTCDLMMTTAETGIMSSLLDVQTQQVSSSNSMNSDSSEIEVCVDTEDGSHVCLEQEVCPTADWVRFNHKCYLFLGKRTTADQNMELCEAMNSSMLGIDDDEVNTFLQSEMTTRGIQQLILAANDRMVDWDWVWAPGIPVLNPKWIPGEPNFPYENCVLVQQTNMEWNNIQCNVYKADAACEVHLSISP